MSKHLSLEGARQLHLHAQGLQAPMHRQASKADVLAAIRRMALLQIDTISVVARSPYLVLWSRLGAYDPVWLDELLAERRLFEYWAHEACFVPIEDYLLLRHRMLDPAAMGWKYSVRWLEAHRAEIDGMLAHIRERGPVRAADIESSAARKGTGWWDWKPEKRHLEVLFTAGELMIKERRGFQRVYDLRERVLPEWDDARYLPPVEAAQQAMVRASCRALGIVKAGWVADYYRLPRKRYDALLHALADLGELVPVRVEGWGHDAFVDATHAEALDEAAAERLGSTVTTLLSPFDPVVWDRRRAAELWGFHYRIECYVPAARRQYGYYVLPILHRGRFVGRLDAKAHRDEGVFELKAVHWEAGLTVTGAMRAEVSAAIRHCADWHGTPRVSGTV